MSEENQKSTPPQYEDPRKYVVVCGHGHVSVSETHKFTAEEAEAVRKNMEDKLNLKLEQLGDEELDTKEVRVERERLEWKISTLRVEKLVLN
jgi:thiamine kinase-like enzyme